MASEVVGKQHGEVKRFSSNFYVRNMDFGSASVVLNLSPRGTRKEIVLTSNVKINFVRLNLKQGLQ